MIFLSLTSQCVHGEVQDPALDPYVKVLLNQQSVKQDINHLSERFAELKNILSETRTWLQTYQENLNSRINSEVMRSHDDNRSDRDKFLGDLKDIRELFNEIKLAMETKHLVFAGELQTIKNLLQASDTKLSEWIKKTEDKLTEWSQLTETLITESKAWTSQEIQGLKQVFQNLSHQNERLTQQNEILIRQNKERKATHETPTYSMGYIFKRP